MAVNHRHFPEAKTMQSRLPRAMLAVLAVFIGAVVLSIATDGTVSDIGFLAYAVALVLLAVLAAAWLVVRLRAPRR
jgi:lysylphosphatidylglycerol synthetase-like protein (DUF2156 family)